MKRREKGLLVRTGTPKLSAIRGIRIMLALQESGWEGVIKAGKRRPWTRR